MIELSRNLKNSYIGFVFKEENDKEPTIAVYIDNDMVFIPITDREKKFENIEINQAYVSIVDFLDGTSSVDYYYAELNKFENIFVWFLDIFIIELYEKKSMRKNLENYSNKPLSYFERIKDSLLSKNNMKIINKYKDLNIEWVEKHLNIPKQKD